uniref:Hypothetical secreted peptide n=1 Tax=Simulium vittatum TaxID=7192 RepID=B5M0Q1_SIMVI|nr:hypothetical secreted peptide precursor [Simulium vittatum]
MKLLHFVFILVMVGASIFSPLDAAAAIDKDKLIHGAEKALDVVEKVASIAAAGATLG